MFWQSHPYSWPVVGWPSDLRVYTLAQAQEYYDTYYAPGNLTAAIVGNFEMDEVEALAERYFGRLEASLGRGRRTSSRSSFRSRPKSACARSATASRRSSSATTRCPSGTATPTRSTCSRGCLNGRSGRLYKSLVLDQGIASDAGARARTRASGRARSRSPRRRRATPRRRSSRPRSRKSSGRIRDEPIPERELQKVKNQITASAYRRLASGFFLLIQLLLYDGLGDWEYINEWAENTLAVTDADVQRVAAEYLVPSNRAVALYLPGGGQRARRDPDRARGAPRRGAAADPRPAAADPVDDRRRSARGDARAAPGPDRAGTAAPSARLSALRESAPRAPRRARAPRTLRHER